MLFQELNSFLEKYRAILKHSFLDKKIIKDIIFRECNFSVSEEQIEYRGDEIIVHSSSLVKNKIFLHKDNLLNKIKQQYPKVTNIS